MRALAAGRRPGESPGTRRLLQPLSRVIFPDHWSQLFGEVALYCLVILVLTGVPLMFWFQPSTTDVVYHGSYVQLRGVRMSQAFASTLDISFDVRGGLLIRQIHHWASDLFLAAVMAHMIRVFIHGGYRRPRESNWLIGVALFALAMAEGLVGNWLPGDMLSGTGVRVMDGILLSVPLIGTYLAFWLFGGDFPGHVITGRLYALHVVVIPGLMLALVAGHLLLTYRHRHSRVPGGGRTSRNVASVPAGPRLVARTGPVFLFTLAIVTLLAAVAQIDPVWLYGPYTPVSASAGSGPEFYLGMIEGAIRIMPGWEWNLLGHTLTFSIVIPAVVLPGVFFTAAALWPYLERWITGDLTEHHVSDRPRDASARTAIAVAVITFWGILWAEGADDIIANNLHLSLELITQIARFTVLIGPVAAYLITKRVCLGLQRRDLDLLEHGVPTGIIRQLPSGGYVEETRPLSADARAVLRAGKAPPRPAAAPAADQGVPAPGSRSGLGRVRQALGRALTETMPAETMPAETGGDDADHRALKASTTRS
jgi:ubiquinol-cytochrome c reductase cytochrome b subunit